ncbi:MAG: ureidoglycolate lyase [Pseudomonadota bacterium]
MRLIATRLTAAAFEPFGEVVALGQGQVLEINQGRCHRHHDLARLDFSDGSAGISLFHSEVRPIPYHFDLLERHPDGSQCFLPMGGSDYLVVVAPDADGGPGDPQAFLAAADQGVNYKRATWHGVLAPISGSGLFGVVDRIGAGKNLEEHWLPWPISVDLPKHG